MGPMILDVLTTLLLAVSSVAAPTGSGSGGSCSPIYADANFEDAPASTVPLPTDTLIYKGLFYQAYNIFQQASIASMLPGLQAHSPPNLIGTSPRKETVSGTPMLTVNFPGSTTKSFTLESFYFGCAVSTGTATVAGPVACLITLTGYTGNDNRVSAANQVCSQQFQYNPSTMTGPQQLAFSGPVLSCFKDMQFMQVTYSLPGGLSAASADASMGFDSLKYSYKTC